jgi:hypothetical protein
MTASRAETTTTDILIQGRNHDHRNLPGLAFYFPGLNFRPGKLLRIGIEHGVIAPLQRIQLGLARRGVGGACSSGCVFFA